MLILNRALACIGSSGLVAAGLMGTPSTALAVNLLTDPSFETTAALVPGVGVLTNIPGNANAWGAENSAIVGTVGAIVPCDALKMLEMSDDGLIATQAWQAVNVSSFATAIDAGQMLFTASACYNVQQSVAAASASTGMFYVDNTGVYGNFTNPFTSSGLVLDNNPSTWQLVTHTGPVPVGTRWMIFQSAYANATLVGTTGAVEHGYVDAAFLELRAIPEPTSVASIATVALVVRRRRL